MLPHARVDRCLARSDALSSGAAGERLLDVEVHAPPRHEEDEMITENPIDPDEYTPGPDSVTAPEEYEPEVTVDDPFREANPADVAEQAIELPDDDGDPEGDDDEVS